MTISRFFIEQPLANQELIDLPEKVAHHLVTVLRKKPAEKLILFNGDGFEYQASIEQIRKKQVSVRIHQHTELDNESPLNITLAQGISKGQKMDMTLQKAVELGVKRVVPIMNERSTVQLKAERIDSRMAHWQQVIISACEQCGRNRIPELIPPMTVEDWGQNDNADHKLLLSPEAKHSLSSVAVKPADSISLMVGSEGGLNQHEIEQLLQAGYQNIQLGPRILRTETAALVMLSLCQAQWGDLVD